MLSGTTRLPAATQSAGATRLTEATRLTGAPRLTGTTRSHKANRSATRLSRSGASALYPPLTYACVQEVDGPQPKPSTTRRSRFSTRGPYPHPPRATVPPKVWHRALAYTGSAGYYPTWLLTWHGTRLRNLTPSPGRITRHPTWLPRLASCPAGYHPTHASATLRSGTARVRARVADEA